MAFLLTWKNVLPVLLKSANALLQVPHRNFSPGSWGDSSSRGPKQANRSSETARNFLRSAFRLLRFFPQTEHLKTSVYLQWTQLLPSKQNIAAVAPFCFPRSRLYGSVATRLRMHNSILLSKQILTQANDARERCHNDWWDNSQTFKGYEWPWGLNSCLKSVEICLLKTRYRSIHGMAVFTVCWDGSVGSRFRLDLCRNRWVGATT